MASGVGLLVRVSLGSASTQYLWRLVRTTFYRTAFLDDLFSMRTNVLPLLRVLAKREAGTLVILVLFIWSISIAVSFPAGAVSVEQATRVSNANVLSYGTWSNVSSTDLVRLVPLIFNSFRSL